MCKKNLCEECKGHNNHKIKEFIKINNNNQEIKGYIDKLKDEINKIKQKLDNIIENLEIYNKINENLYKDKYREYKNYEKLMNKNQINKFKKTIKQDIEKIIDEKNIKKKKKNLMNIYEKMNSNYISGKIKINKDDINKDIRIINSFEEFKKIKKIKDEEKDYINKNEEEIKNSIIIKINDKNINFNYFHKFEKEEVYEIKYIFKKKYRMHYVF